MSILAFTLLGSEFHRVDPETEKHLDTIFVLTVGMKTSKLGDRMCLDVLAGVRSECGYAGCVDESARYLSVHILKIIRCRTG